MIPRSHSKQSKSYNQLTTAQENPFLGNTVRKPQYPRDQMSGTTSQQQSYKIKSPIKSLQMKHKNLEMQLQKLSAEVANRNYSNTIEQEKKRNQRTSFNISSNVDQKLGGGRMSSMNSNTKLRIVNKDRSASGAKRCSNLRPQMATSSGTNLKMISPMMTTSKTLGAHSTATTQKQDSKRYLKDIIGQAKKNHPSLKLKLANKGPKMNSSQNFLGKSSGTSGGSTLLQGTPNDKIGSFNHQRQTNSSSTKQYFTQSHLRVFTDGTRHNTIEDDHADSKGFDHLKSNLGAHSRHSSRGHIAKELKDAWYMPPQAMSSDDDFKQLMRTPQGLMDTDPSLGEFDPSTSPMHIGKLLNGPRQAQPNNILMMNSMKIDTGLPQHQRTLFTADGFDTRNNGVGDAAYNFKQVLSDSSAMNEINMTNNTGASQFPTVNAFCGNTDLVKGLETGILSVHSHIKSLEGKYIDLANYYKREMLKDSPKQLSERHVAVQALRRAGSQESSFRNTRGAGQATNSRSLSKCSRSKATDDNIRCPYDTDIERGIIDEVKTEKQKLEGEMRNLIGIYAQLIDEDQSENFLKRGYSGFKEKASETFSHGFRMQTVALNKILTKHQGILLTHAKTDQALEKEIERQFDELFDELSQWVRQSGRLSNDFAKLPTLTLMERLEKISGDYDIQQEYSLSNFKETMFQLHHCNDQLQLDLKRINLNFTQIEKRLQEKDRGSRSRISEPQESLATLIERTSAGLAGLSSRFTQNEQKMEVLQENHAEAVRYLRQYRDNMKKISDEYTQAQQQQPAMQGQPNHDNSIRVDTNSHDEQTEKSREYHDEITQLNQEIFQLRTQLTEAKSHGVVNLNELKDELELLNRENESLTDKINGLTAELVQKNSLIVTTLRERDDLKDQLQRSQAQQVSTVDVQGAQIFEDYWMQTCRDLVRLSQKFLVSMRKLQKAVHRKESNFQEEKQTFDAATKELEAKLKEVRVQLERKPSTEPVLPINKPAQVAAQGSSSSLDLPTPLNNQQVMDIHKQGTDHSHVPHKESPHQKTIDDLEAEKSQANKKLQKEKQKNQTLLNELKMSQDNLSKLRQTTVARTTFTDLEAQVKQLQETLEKQAGYEIEQSTQLEELQRTVDDQKNMLEGYAQQLAQKPDFSNVLISVSEKINEIVQKQSVWVKSAGKLIKEKERKVTQLQDSVKAISLEIQGKNEEISTLKSDQSHKNGEIIYLTNQLGNQKEAQKGVNESQTQLQKEILRLQGELKVKNAGRTMLSTLMFGIKAKLLAELKNAQGQLEARETQIVQLQTQQDKEKKELEAKLASKKQKSALVKTLIAKKDEELQDLKSRMGSSESERDAIVTSMQAERDQALSKLTQETDKLNQEHAIQLTQLQDEIAELQNTLKVKTNGSRIMSALMQAFKQKILDEQKRYQTVINETQADLTKVRQDAKVSGEQIVMLQAKIEKKKFKQGQTKVLIAKAQEDQQLVLGAKRKVEDQLVTKENDLQTIQAQFQTAEGKVQSLESNISEMQTEHSSELEKLKTAQSNLQAQIKTLKAEKEELSVAMRGQIDSLSESEKAKEMRLSETIKNLQKDSELRSEEVRQAEDQISKLQGKLKKMAADSQAMKNSHKLEIQEVTETANSKLEKVTSEKDAAVSDLEDKLTQATQDAQKLQSQLDKALKDAQVETESSAQQIKDLKITIQSTQEENSKLKEDVATVETNIKEKEAEVSSLADKIKSIEAQNETFKAEQDQIQAELRQSRDAAQAQLTEMINQTKFEKESLEGRLQSQLNQTLEQLNAREDECETLQKQLKELKEANGKLEIETNDLTSKLDDKEQSLTEAKTKLASATKINKENQATLEQNRELILQFKTELQKSVDSVKSKNEENETLNKKVEALDADILEKDDKIADLETVQKTLESDKDALSKKVETLNTDLLQKDSKLAELEAALKTLESGKDEQSVEAEKAVAQTDKLKVEVDRLTQENQTFREQIASLKQEFSSKAAELQDQIEAERQTIKEKDELISEADQLLAEFNSEKHEVKAKFKHLMQIVSLKAAGSEDGDEEPENEQSQDVTIAASSYKGRDGEVDLNHCFSELEQIVIDFKERQESKIIELISDKEQLVGTVQEQKQDLEAMQASLASLQDELASANTRVEQNDQEARRQIDTATRKIKNYKEELEAQRLMVASLESQIQQLNQQLETAKEGKNAVDSDSDLNNSYFALQKENMQLLQRLQKTEQALARARGGEDLSDEDKAPKTQTITLSPEVAEKLDDIDLRMAEIKRELHMAKSTCLKDLMTKHSEKLKAAQRTFVKTELLEKAISGDKINGWNNIVKECRRVTYNDRQFILVEQTDEKTFHLVDLAQVTHTTMKYLKAFVEDYDDEDFVQDAIEQNAFDLDQEPEIEKLNALVTDLRSDRIELQAELENFRDGGKGDTTRLAALKDEEMKDDIEYLTGENKDLHLKVKEVCLSRALLQKQLAEARRQIAQQIEESEEVIDPVQADLDQIDASSIAPSKNIRLGDDVFAPVQELLDESSRQPDQGPREYLSDQDSIIHAVNQIDEEEENIRASNPIHQVKLLRQTIAKLEGENEELKSQLEKAEQAITRLEESKQISVQDVSVDENPLEHIKGILSQFLRNVPPVDKQNEDLLTVIFNMLNFTDTEIQELKIARLNIKLNKGKPAHTRNNSRSITTGNSTNSISREDDGTLKPKRSGLFGMFGGGKKNTSSTGNISSGTPTSQSNASRPAPRR